MRRLFVIAPVLAVIACGNDVTGPEPPPPPVIVAPSPAMPPAPAATPVPVAAGGLDLSFSAGACFSVTNNNEIAVGLSAWYTSFDDQETQFGFLAKPHLPSGESWGHCYNVPCVQVDVDHPGVKPLGGYWFDINQQPFNPSRSPEKVAECRNRPTPNPTPTPTPSPSPSPCAERWLESNADITFGACTRLDPALECTREVTYDYFLINSCTGEKKPLMSHTEVESCQCTHS